jgi:hypothetical protein
MTLFLMLLTLVACSPAQQLDRACQLRVCPVDEELYANCMPPLSGAIERVCRQECTAFLGEQCGVGFVY